MVSLWDLFYPRELTPGDSESRLNEKQGTLVMVSPVNICDSSIYLGNLQLMEDQ